MHEPKRVESRRNHDGSWYCVDSVIVGAPAAVVFSVLEDLEGYSSWWPGVRISVDGDVARGARGVFSVREGVYGLRSEFEIETVEPGRRVRLRCTKGGATGAISFEVGRVEDACRATILWDGVTVRAPIARLLFRLFGPSFHHKKAARGLRGLQRAAAEALRREPRSTRPSFSWRGSTPE